LCVLVFVCMHIWLCVCVCMYVRTYGVSMDVHVYVRVFAFVCVCVFVLKMTKCRSPLVIEVTFPLMLKTSRCWRSYVGAAILLPLWKALEATSTGSRVLLNPLQWPLPKPFSPPPPFSSLPTSQMVAARRPGIQFILLRLIYFCILMIERDREEGKGDRVEDMQQRTAGWIQTRGRCVQD
jgi:hypothetical protein